MRDAHAKLRTTNEKLRREKENSFRQNLRFDTNEINSSKIHCILDIVSLQQTTKFSLGLFYCGEKFHFEFSFEIESIIAQKLETKNSECIFMNLL